MTKISAEHKIVSFFHCRKCLEEKPQDVSPRDWASTEAGWTKQGFQVWCKRHECNILHVDFEGTHHPANTGVSNIVHVDFEGTHHPPNESAS